MKCLKIFKNSLPVKNNKNFGSWTPQFAISTKGRVLWHILTILPQKHDFLVLSITIFKKIHLKMAQMAGAFSQPGPLVRLSEMSNRNRTCQPGRATPPPMFSRGLQLGKRPFQGKTMCPCQGTLSTSSEGQQSCS